MTAKASSSNSPVISQQPLPSWQPAEKIPARGANGGGDAKRPRVTVNGKPIDYNSNTP